MVQKNGAFAGVSTEMKQTINSKKNSDFVNLMLWTLVICLGNVILQRNVAHLSETSYHILFLGLIGVYIIGVVIWTILFWKAKIVHASIRADSKTKFYWINLGKTSLYIIFSIAVFFIL